MESPNALAALAFRAGSVCTFMEIKSTESFLSGMQVPSETSFFGA